MLEVFNLFIVLRLNAKQIYLIYQINTKKKVNYITICSILVYILKCIANYLKHKYRYEQIVGDPSLIKIVAVNESLFLQDDTGKQIWIVGALDSQTKDLRLDVINQRNSTDLKIFVNHIVSITLIVHNGWNGYAFLNDDDSVYSEEEYNHGGGKFGNGLHSTSHIEGIWNWIKSEIKFLYRNYLFIRECEYRFTISDLSDKSKVKNFRKVLKTVYILNSYLFYDEEELLNFNNYDY